MKLHLDPKSFSEAIQATAQNLKIREVFVEKDYWVCFVLKNLSLSDFKSRVVFKGGTSLSKAYGAIYRFSEDIDLALVLDGENDTQVKKTIKQIEDKIATEPLIEMTREGITSKGSRFRKTVWQFEKESSGWDYGSASPDLLLEINSFVQPFPFHEMGIQTYISEDLTKQKNPALIKEFELEKFSVNVLDYKRTFTEKIAAISRACFESNESLNELKNKIRHLYDVTMLMRSAEIQKFVENGQFAKLCKQVQKDDSLISTTQNKSSKRDWKEAAAFKNPKETLKELAGTYQGQFSTLLFQSENNPTLQEIEKCLKKIADQ